MWMRMQMQMQMQMSMQVIVVISSWSSRIVLARRQGLGKGSDAEEYKVFDCFIHPLRRMLRCVGADTDTDTDTGTGTDTDNTDTDTGVDVDAYSNLTGIVVCCLLVASRV